MDQKIRKVKTGVRGITRLYAVQMLYKAENLNCTLQSLLKYTDNDVFVSEDEIISEIDKEFFAMLIEKLDANIDNVRAIISANLTDSWKFERLNPVLRCIVQLGAVEILYCPEIPLNVSFNEYVEIAKSFFDKKEVAFVNGILNKISKEDVSLNSMPDELMLKNDSVDGVCVSECENCTVVNDESNEQLQK